MRLRLRAILALACLAAPAGLFHACRSRRPTTRPAPLASAAPRPTTLVAPAEAGDWPLFRGDPGLTGLAAGELPDALKLHWRARTGGAVKSSAAIVGGKVFVGSDDGHVYCLDLLSGRKLWSFKTGEGVEASPTVLDAVVYVGSADGLLYALDAATGALKWKYETEDRILGAANWASAPAGRAKRILVGSYDGSLHCVDAATGRMVWKHDTDDFVNGTAAVGSRRAVFGGCDGKIHIVSLDTGAGTDLDAGKYVAASPAISAGRAFIGSVGGDVICVDLHARKIVWRRRWREESFFSSPAAGKGRLVIGSQDGRVYCLAQADGEELWAFRAGGKADSSPVICGGKVVFGSGDGRVYVVRLRDGEKLWSYDTGDEVSASPAVAGGMIVIGSENGSVYAFGPAAGAPAAAPTVDLVEPKGEGK